MQSALEAQRRQDGPPGVILVGHRRSKQGHKAVPEELIDRALVAVDCVKHQLKKVTQ